ncbi:Cephalosporin hydroxylase [Flavobacterium flevense]|uniref:Cephalosporin hydroxylase n=1 Tax=Flavobacterium flevense TaxID=983 RepID=A0A4Y4AZI9_9FLAO|nr:CmcI family methyltransferase [Flavobacterium flevense]GEC73661.1 cephalosporin hydroxylase [Flavobacterium flevense]SHL99784.1 Cephalosporin hydroxylase [Flavobacterium flevense]
MFKKNRIIKEEQVQFSIDSIYRGHHEVTYKGIKAIRCPFDYVIYQMIINEVKPDLVIEIGTNIGGGALYIADLLDMNGKGVIHTIDIVDMVDAKVREHNRIEFFTKGWLDYDLELTKGFNNILVIEDASHFYQDSIGILNKFHNVVSKDSYFIVEDGIINELGLEKDYKGGPLKALREFLPNHPEFFVDRKWCDMFGINATFNVNGYLKKK